LPMEEVLTCLNHFNIVSNYHHGDNEREVVEMSTLLENIIGNLVHLVGQELQAHVTVDQVTLIDNITH
jgi:hypothetical protein